MWLCVCVPHIPLQSEYCVTSEPGNITLYFHGESSEYRILFLLSRPIRIADISPSYNNLHYIPSPYKSTKHFSANFSFDAPKIWNDLPADIRSAPSLMSFRSRLKVFIFRKAYPPIFVFSVVGTLLYPWFMALDNYCCSKHLRVCFAEIKRYKS